MLNALTVYQIPEPATLSMIGIFGAGALVARRRMKKA